MSEAAQISRLQNVIIELRQDIGAHQKELSSKTKKLVEHENIISQLRQENKQKGKRIDDLERESKATSDHQIDAMHLQIEEYQMHLQTKENEKQQLKRENNLLNRQCQTLRQQFENLQYKHQQSENQYKVKLQRQESIYKTEIEKIKRIHQQQIKTYQDQLDANKQQQFLLSNQETQNIKNSLNELRQSHDQIEQDLNVQIEDLKDQMTKREKEKENLVKELNQLSDDYKKWAQNEINQLQQKLSRYEQGDVEVILKIEVDDPIIHKPPPKKPAPPKPQQQISDTSINLSLHSRQSSNASSKHSKNDSGGSGGSGQSGQSGDSNDDNTNNILLSPMSDDNNNINGNKYELTLENIRSNPEFWRKDYSNPNGAHHKLYPSQGSMPLLYDNDVSDDDVGDDIVDNDDNNNDNNNDNDNDDPQSTMIETKSANTISISQYISKRNNNKSLNHRPKIPHIKASKSANSIPMSSSYGTSKARTPTFYIFRPSISNKDGNKDLNNQLNDNDNDNDKSSGYNVIAQKYNNNKRKKIDPLTPQPQSSLNKYTDSSAWGGIRTGIKNLFGPTTPTPNKTRNKRVPSTAHSVRTPSVRNGIQGYPYQTRRNRTEKRPRSVSSLPSSEIYDDISLGGSSIGFRDNASSSTKLSPSDALGHKSMELQREMYRQANNRLAEDLKNANKKVMVIKQQAHRKYKQLQIQMQTEQRQWKLKEQELSEKLDRKIKETQKNEFVISEIEKKFKALKSDYNMRIQQQDPQLLNGNNNMNNNMNNNNNNGELLMKLQSLESNNKQLIIESDKYRRELSGLKKTILSCNDTMRQQQQQILILNAQISELRKIGPTSSNEELYQKQIRLLKSQRRMLVKELKEVREQNEKLKNIIVTGGSNGIMMTNGALSSKSNINY